MDKVCPGLLLCTPDPLSALALFRFASSHAVHWMWSYTRRTVSAVTPSPALVIDWTICARASRPLCPVDLCSHNIRLMTLVGIRWWGVRFLVGVMSERGGSCSEVVIRHVW